MKSASRWLAPVGLVLALGLPLRAQSSSASPAGSTQRGSASGSKAADAGAAQRNGNPNSRPGLPRVEPWWHEQSPISKELGLTKDQSEKIEKLFQETTPDFRKLNQDLSKREDMLSQYIQDNVSETLVAKRIDMVEETRSAMNKVRSLMLYRMRLVLNPWQRSRFETLHEQFDLDLQQRELDQQRQDQKRRQEEAQKATQKPATQPAPDRRGRPGF